MTEAPATAEAEAPAADLIGAENQGSAELAVREAATALERAPIIDRLNERQLALLKAKSPNLSHAELAQAMELAWAYQLDPYANEIWFTKSRPKNGREGKLLIMVGRDGLRKIAQRNGLEVEGDLVCEKDTFKVTRIATPVDLAKIGASPGDWRALGGGSPFHHVQHERTGVGRAARGAVVGAWCRVYERRTKVQRGYLDAGIEEYDQSGRDDYGPWNKQKSAMMLGAVERQAIRQATPLGGLLADGEDRLVDAESTAEELPPPLAGIERADEVAEVLARAERAGHAGLADVAAAQMALRGQPPERVGEWIERAEADLQALEVKNATEAEEPPEAEVVEPAPEAPAEPDDEEPDDGPRGLRDRIEDLREQIVAAESFGDQDTGDLQAQLEALEAELAAQDDPGQTSLLG